MPRRGAVALVTTVLAVVLLFSFRPADPTGPLTGGLPSGGFQTDPPFVAQRQQTPTPALIGPPAPTQQTTVGGNRGGSRATPGATQPPPLQPTDTPASNSNGTTATFTGKAIATPYGTVQIALVVQDGRITDVEELQLPSDRRLSQQISAEAGPMLRDQVIQAQSDHINGVSGASYTSYGFYLSLQSALQQM